MPPSSALQGFNDPYAFHEGSSALTNRPILAGKPGSAGAAVTDWLGWTSVNKDYAQAQTNDNRAYERASINSARAWDKYMSDTAVQRSVEDIKKAGLNPWLAVQSGIHSGGSGSADTGGSAQNMTSSGQSKSILSSLLMAVAMLIRPGFKKP